MDQSPFIVDADDFHAGNTSIEALCWIKERNPNFKITLFTILGRCTKSFIEDMRDKYGDWMDFAAHGWRHETNDECVAWDEKKCWNYLELAEVMEVTKGFRAPGWKISDAMYKVLLKRKWWVADQEYNNHRRPVDLPCHLNNHVGLKRHYHIGHVGGINFNEIEKDAAYLAGLTNHKFEFVKDVVKVGVA